MYCPCGCGPGYRVGGHKHGGKGKAAEAYLVDGRKHGTGIDRRREQRRQSAHGQTSDKDREHDPPTGNARPEQDNGTQEYGQHRGLTYRAGNQSEKIVERREGLAHDIVQHEVSTAVCGHLPQRGGSREGIDHPAGSEPEGIGRADKDLIARHLGGVGKEEECPRNESHIEDIHTRTAEDLLGKYHGKGGGDGYHPQRSVDRHNQGYQDTRYEETLLYLVPAPLGHDKLDAETHDIGYDDFGEDGQKAEKEDCPEADSRKLANGQVMLIAHIVHTEKQGRHQRQYDDRHGALGIDAVV